MPEAASVRSMFAGISRRYDLANHVLSGGLDFYWRRRLAAQVARTRPSKVIDLATGSGDVALTLKKHLGPSIVVEGYDFCEPMLEKARAKAARSSQTARVPFAVADCLDLPLPDGYADVVTIAFGLRNLENRLAGLQEMKRVLRPDGHLFVLEFTQPAPWFRPIYLIYLKYLLPLLARIVCGNRTAYDYLAGSIEAFPSKESLTREIREAGFRQIRATTLSASIVAIHHAQMTDSADASDEACGDCP